MMHEIAGEPTVASDSAEYKRFSALLTDGSNQLWIEKSVADENGFRDYLNTTFPYHICLYCKVIPTILGI